MDFNVNVNVKLDATPALTGAVSALAGALRPSEVKTPATVALPAEESTVQEQAPKEAPAPPAETVKPMGTNQEEISNEQLRAFIGPKSKEKGKDAIFAVLDEFGVSRVPDLKPEQRRAFMDKVNAL